MDGLKCCAAMSVTVCAEIRRTKEKGADARKGAQADGPGRRSWIDHGDSQTEAENSRITQYQLSNPLDHLMEEKSPKPAHSIAEARFTAQDTQVPN